MKTLIFAVFLAASLAAIPAQGQSPAYHAPAHNYYQNNWMSRGN